MSVPYQRDRFSDSESTTSNATRREGSRWSAPMTQNFPQDPACLSLDSNDQPRSYDRDYYRYRESESQDRIIGRDHGRYDVDHGDGGYRSNKDAHYSGASGGRYNDESGSDRRRVRSRSRSRSRDRDDYRGGGRNGHMDKSSDRYRHAEGYRFGSSQGSGGYGGSSYSGGTSANARERSLHPVSSTVIIKGLPAHTTEPVETGECKGFAFVQFYSNEYAEYFMNTYAGSWGDPKAPQLIVENRAVSLDYCRDEPSSAAGPSAHAGSGYSRGPGGNTGGGFPPRADWICGACSCHNFARRSECYRCSKPRSEDSLPVPAGPQDPAMNSEAMSASETPSQTLVVKGIPPMSTEAQIMEMFRQYAVVVNVHLMRDWSTGMSRGIAFVEFQSVEHAAHTKSMTQQIRMGSTYLKVGFARPGYEKFFQQQPAALVSSWPAVASVPASLPFAPIAAAPPIPVPAPALATSAHPSVVALLSQAIPQPSGSNSATSITHTPAAVAAPAIKSSRRWPPSFETSGAAYVFQPQSGLFFESISKFYYCPKSKTYYNTATGEYFRHNGGSDPESAFELVSAPVVSGSAEHKEGMEQKVSNTSIESTKETAPDGPRKPVVISIGLGNKSKLAKPMGIQKEIREASLPTTSVAVHSQESVVTGSAFGKVAADASNISKWEERKRKEVAEDPSKVSESTDSAAQVRSGIIASQPTGPMPSPVSTAPVCLLCQRQFPSMEVLARHERESKLHAENLAKAEALKASSASSESGAGKYRDRAQERRSQHPSEEEMHPKENQEKTRSSKRSDNLSHYGPPVTYALSENPQSAFDSSAAPVSSDEANPGNQLLRRMGWNEGSGLGKDGSGSVTPIAIDQEAKALAPGTKTGVGVISSIPPVIYGDDKTYKESLNRATRARFEQLNK